MIARVARFDVAPEDAGQRDWVVDALRGVEGVRSCYHLHDPRTGAVLSISFYEDEAAADRAVEAIRARAEQRGHVGRHPDAITLFDVTRYIENR